MTTKTTKFPKGSEWRKWDLHVHSPESEGFTGDWPSYVIQLGNSDCAVIGINDYFSVAGYVELRRRLNDPHEGENGNQAYREALEKLRQKHLLPVIECRMTNFLVDKKNGGQRINFHIILSDAINPDNITTFIKTQKVKGGMIGERYADKKFLLEEVAVDFFGVLEQLQQEDEFRDKFLVWMPYDEYGGIDPIDPKADRYIKEHFIQCSHILGSSNAKQAEFFLWKNEKFSQEQYEEWFERRKPCIKGSDSHNVHDEVGRLKDKVSKPTDRYCWIKADPTFDGLRQIVNEPEDRVFIGPIPPKLDWVSQHKTNVISRVRIAKKTGSAIEDVWFDCDIPINHDMVAIIGNKGSGKSALADIIALSGDTSNATHFSFLAKKKFRDKRLASNFDVTITRESTVSVTRNLQDDPEPHKPETIKYIPQTYLEKICTETSADEESEFQQELRKVIFSHISDADRLGKDTLEDLIAYKTEEIGSELNRRRQALAQTNATIAGLEAKQAPDNIKQLKESLGKKKEELDAHDTTKPAEVQKPDNLTDEQKKQYTEIEAQLTAKNAELDKLTADIRVARESQRRLAEQLAVAGKLAGRLANIETELDTLKQQSADAFKQIGLAIDDVLSFSINRKPLNDKKAALEGEKAAVDVSLSAEAPESLVVRHKVIQDEIVGLRGQLDAPSRRYQSYLQQLKAWQDRRNDIIGSPDAINSLTYYEAQLKYISDTLPTELVEACKTCRASAVEIHKCISSIRSIYAQLFAPVQDVIEKSVVIKEGFKLSFASAITQRGFMRQFFDNYVSQGVNGSFCGKEAGEKRLQELLDDCDFNEPEQAIAFVEAIEAHLATDYRSAVKLSMLLSAQLRRHATPEQLHNFLWSFEYLTPEYSLKLDSKDLAQLSPGERGALLLVFYLLVDMNDDPIMVDQPEENLDNQTVFHLLIPVIKAVKRRRQIIMVTHNPNIAVVCDAEQIIYASIDRADKNRITYESGAIEEPLINKHILDVLEGTRPAFDNRDAKYIS